MHEKDWLASAAFAYGRGMECEQLLQAGKAQKAVSPRASEAMQASLHRDFLAQGDPFPTSDLEE